MRWVRRDGGGTEDVQDDLVFVCELEFGREIVEGFFFLLSMDVGEVRGAGTRDGADLECFESVLDAS